MGHRKQNLGFAAVETVLILIVVALVAFVGYKVYSTKNLNDKTVSNTTSGSNLNQSGQASIPQINTASDLTKAEQALTQNDTSGSDNSDLAKLDSELSNF